MQELVAWPTLQTRGLLVDGLHFSDGQQQETAMAKRSSNQVPEHLPFPPTAGRFAQRPGNRFTAPPAAGNRGFIVPVLVVFSALWFLLSGSRVF